MDTRAKILPLAEALVRAASDSLPIVQLDADPLLIDVLDQLPPACLLLVAPRDNSYLPIQARLELAASRKPARDVALGPLPGALDLRPAEDAARLA
ncbi:MAG: hypothetical protein ACK6DX_22770, partial [Acidobacteriota bacterium]